jgi:hypothetical protein
MTNAELMTKSECVAHACSMPRSASLLDLFNANGAYQPSLGQRHREVKPCRVEALKARFIQPWFLSQADTRFRAGVIRIPGALPQAYVRKAPMALRSQCLP